MKVGVLVFNLGGPETLRDVKPFLYRLFSDPEIIRIKWDPRERPLAYTIATLRRKKSEGYYRANWRRIADAQADGRAGSCASGRASIARAKTSRHSSACAPWHPFLSEAIDKH